MGTSEFGPLCRIAYDSCKSNLRFISSKRPGLLEDLGALFDDAYDLMLATAVSNPDSLFIAALVTLVRPFANYVRQSVLECEPYSSISLMRLIIESLAVGLYADRWFGDNNIADKVASVKGFEMGGFRKCKGRGKGSCGEYEVLSNEVNKALDWLSGSNLDTEPMDFVYETYNYLSKVIHPVSVLSDKFGEFRGMLELIISGRQSRKLIVPTECREEDLPMLDLAHWCSLRTRLSMDMLIYAWGVVTGRVGKGELEKAKANIKDVLRRIDENKELKDRFEGHAKTNH